MSKSRGTSTLNPAFHTWLLEQVSRDDAVGDLARDYQTGVELGIHERAERPEDLIEILHEQGAIPKAVDAAVRLGEEWMRGQ